MARRPRGRGILATVLLPDPGVDGKLGFVDWCRFVTGRLVFIGEIGLITVAAGGLLSTWLAHEWGWVGFAAGWFFGAVIGFTCPFYVGFGFTIADDQEGWQRARTLLIAWICLFVGIGFQVLQGSVWIAKDRELQTDAENTQAALGEQAETMRDTTSLDQRLEDARGDVAVTLAAREAAEQLRTELAGLPAGEWSARTAEIQTIIGARPDGVKYELTVNAMADYAEAARLEYDAAIRRRDEAQAKVDERDALVVSGQVASVDIAAAAAGKAETNVDGFRQLARQSFRLLKDPRQNDEAAIDERSKTISELFSYILPILLTLFNWGLNNHSRRDDEEENYPIGRAPAPRLPPPSPARAAPIEAFVPAGPVGAFVRQAAAVPQGYVSPPSSVAPAHMAQPARGGPTKAPEPDRARLGAETALKVLKAKNGNAL